MPEQPKFMGMPFTKERTQGHLLQVEAVANSLYKFDPFRASLLIDGQLAFFLPKEVTRRLGQE